MGDSTIISTDRQTNFDCLRILSAVAVVLIHVNAHYLQPHFEAPSDDLIWIAENTINFITRFSVPSFVMLSGAFILSNEKNRSIKLFYEKSFYKIVIPFLAIYLLGIIKSGIKIVVATGSLKSYFESIVEMEFYNLWFMPMLIGIYVFVPFIIRLKNQKQLPMILGIGLLVWAVISQASTEYRLPYSIGVVCAFLSYFFMGNILYEMETRYSSSKCIVWIVSVSVIASWWRCRNHQFYAINAYRAFFSPCVVILSIMVFLLFKNMKMKNSHKLSKLSSAMLYVYLIHTPIMNGILKILDKVKINEIFKIIIGTIVVFISSVIIAFIWIKLRELLNRRFGIKEKVSKFITYF